ncbi:hypothetical protein [Halalkalibacter akibai]|uniref:Uncharacterized protein n=1 Tax=Halalkalibacter akibai (strain ATCC 43226 / DSM 21942 / CIP 109018 / JCM 9157 / 1139) TaxID=1236973 RepID=W4R0C6_HALA3|nr:hypothetical protein [Halalkalibacter akibai]GAE37612.1 hypothetical protein JCM9157_4929 [Halalkalibacter akibai JCM 9157]
MEIELFEGIYLHLPPFYITAIAVIIIYLLFRWSKESDISGLRIFFYFLISTYIAPLYSHGSQDGYFQLWVPLGFIFIFLYLFNSEKYHPSKMKASLLGLAIAIYQMVKHYGGW